MQIELSELERRTLLGALEAYRRIKGAESKLTAHKESTKEAQTAVLKRYGVLLTCVETLQKRLQPSEGQK